MQQGGRQSPICHNNIYPPIIVVYEPHEGEVLTTLAFTFNILTTTIDIPPDLLNPDVKKIDISRPFTPQTGTILANAIARLAVLSFRSEIPRISINARAVNTVFPPICETSFILMRQTRTRPVKKGVDIFSESTGVESRRRRIAPETIRYTPIAVAGTTSALSRIISTTITRGLEVEATKPKTTRGATEKGLEFGYTIRQSYVRFFTSREEVQNYVTTTASSLTTT